MRTVLIFITLCLANQLFAQGFINCDKPKARKYLSKYIREEKVQTITTETDSSITFLVRDSTVQDMDLVLHFDGSGVCDRELIILSCDSCRENILNEILNKKYFGWTKVDASTYLSKFKKHINLRLHTDGPSFEAIRIDISKREYKRLLKK
jgi:hypothetical protein